MARLASLAGIAAQVGYRRRPGRYGGKPAIVAENRLEQQFQASVPDQVWVTDITYIKTHEVWLYLCVVIDLFSRHVVGWSAQSRMTTELALQALLMAVWRRKPAAQVMVHSDQGSQFTSREWQAFRRQTQLDRLWSTIQRDDWRTYAIVERGNHLPAQSFARPALEVLEVFEDAENTIDRQK